MSILDSGILKLRKNEKALMSLLTQAKSQDLVFYGWRLRNQKKILVQLKIDRLEKGSKEFQLICVEDDPTQINLITSGTDKVNLFFPADQVLLQARLKANVSDEKIILSLPKVFVQVERRKKARLKVTESCPVFIKFKKSMNSASSQEWPRTFEKSVYDISTGGLSFLVNKEEAKYFKVNDTLKDLEIVLKNDQIKVIANINNIIQVEPNEDNHLTYGGQKICLKFPKLPAREEEKIKLFVLQNLKDENS